MKKLAPKTYKIIQRVMKNRTVPIFQKCQMSRADPSLMNMILMNVQDVGTSGDRRMYLLKDFMAENVVKGR